MSDFTAPTLKRLVLPRSIDLSKGAVSFEGLVEAPDDAGGSGVDHVSVWLDRPVATDSHRTQILQFGSYSKDNFSDATPAVSTGTFTLLPTTASGTYNIKEVWVTDRAGNNAIYSSQQLQAMGIATSLVVSGGIVDQTGPTLTGLTLPASIDLTKGPAGFNTTIMANDNPGGTGIETAILHFDRPFMLEGSTTGSQFLVTGYGPDRFDDATPGIVTDQSILLQTTNPGTYRLLDVTLRDHAGNETLYTADQLRALGIETAMEVKGSAPDTAGPTLVDLYLPSVIPLQAQPRQIVSAVAVDGAGGSGVTRVFVALDREIQFKEYASAGISIGGIDSTDSFADGTPVYATGGFTLTDATAPGTYRVQGVLVFDAAGNSTHYSAEELQARGINTTMRIVEGAPTATAAVEVAGGEFNLALGSSQWAGRISETFELKLKFNPEQMQFASVKLNGAQSSSLNAKVFAVGNDVAYLTISGTARMAKDAVLELTMSTLGDTRLANYAIDSFTVNGKAQLFGDGRAGTVMAGGTGADVFLDANTATLIDGQGGIDQAVLPGFIDDYRVRKSGDGFVVENFRDTQVFMRDVERVKIGSDWVALDVDGMAGQVYRLYQAAFDRAPDKSGIGYWLGEADRGMKLHTIAELFSYSSEFQGAVGPNPSAETFVGALYDNVLHRTPDQAGFDYWVNTLKATGDHAAVLVAFSESQENVAQVVGAIENGIAYWA